MRHENVIVGNLVYERHLLAATCVWNAYNSSGTGPTRRVVVVISPRGTTCTTPRRRIVERIINFSSPTRLMYHFSMRNKLTSTISEAPLAQSVERSALNTVVAGSSPARGDLNHFFALKS